MNERVLRFNCEGETLFGILAEPGEAASPGVGVLIVVGGPQYRVGSHRQFVVLARALAEAGWPALRFDYRGMGDSTGAPRTFESVTADLQAAIAALLSTRPELQRVVIWGLCDAASAALLYVEAQQDPRVAGLVLLNPWVRSAESLAQTHVKHYYWQRLRQPEFWAKLARGGIGRAAWQGLVSNLRLARARGRQPAAGSPRRFQDRMASGLGRFTGPTLLMISTEDYTAKEFQAWLQAQRGVQGHDLMRQGTTHLLPGADHTLSGPDDMLRMCRHLITWLALHFPAHQPQRSALEA